MKQFVTFAIITALWATLCRLILEFVPVHPAAIGCVWLIGFVWMTGYIAGGFSDADLLTKRWLQMLAGMAVLAWAGFLVFS